jgi:hypothetical protein
LPPVKKQKDGIDRYGKSAVYGNRGISKPEKEIPTYHHAELKVISWIKG